MTQTAMPWVKIYSEFIHDSKIGRLPATAQLLFVKLIIVAGEADADGYLINGEDAMTPQDLAWHMHIDEAQLVIDLELLKASKLIKDEDGYLLVVNFAKRQGRPQSEKREMWRERKARSRAKTNSEPVGHPEDKTNVTRESRVTLEGQQESHASVTPLEGEGEKSREEKNSLSSESAPKNVPSKNPAIAAYVERFGEVPIPEQADLIFMNVTDIEKWSAVLLDWKTHRWKATNIPGMIDSYKNWDKPKPNRNGHKQNVNEPAGFAAIREAMNDPKYKE